MFGESMNDEDLLGCLRARFQSTEKQPCSGKKMDELVVTNLLITEIPYNLLQNLASSQRGNKNLLTYHQRIREICLK